MVKIVSCFVLFMSFVCMAAFTLSALEFFFPLVDTPVAEFAQDSSRLVFWSVSYGKTEFALGLWGVSTAIMFLPLIWAWKNMFGVIDGFDERFEKDWLGV